jgi:hypothetical protein
MEYLRICKNCNYYNHINGWDEVGECRAKAPLPYISGLVNPNSPYKQEMAAIWPGVKATDWCGEHNAEFLDTVNK